MSINLREFLKFRNKSPSHIGVKFHHTVEVKNSMELLEIIITDFLQHFFSLSAPFGARPTHFRYLSVSTMESKVCREIPYRP